MRRIVAGLTGDAEGDLANELSKADPVVLENGQESDDDVSDPEDWVPDPVDADPGMQYPMSETYFWLKNLKAKIFTSTLAWKCQGWMKAEGKIRTSFRLIFVTTQVTSPHLL